MKDIVKSQVNDEYKFINGKKVKVARRRRRSNLMTYCAIAVAICTVIGLAISLFFLFDLEEVQVSGLTLYSNEQILAAGGVEAGKNLIRTNTNVIEDRLLQTLPYIKSVEVDKDYPHSMKISIVEEVKCADIELAGKYYVISPAGKLLEVGNTAPDPELPLVIGFELKEPELGKKIESENELKSKVLLQLLDSIDRCGFKKISQINITERTDIELIYDNRITVKLGSSLDLDFKLASIKGTIDQKLPKDFEGTLKYNSAKSGISAISKAALTTTTAAPKSVSAEIPAAADADPAQTSQEAPAATQPADNGYNGWQAN